MIALIAGLSFLGIMGVAVWRFHFKARFLPIIAMAFIVIGIAALSQPWIKFFYRYGLAILMSGIASYILVSHFE